MKQRDTYDMVLALDAAPIDERTGNKVIYGASFVADRLSMIGVRKEDWVRREIEWFLGGSNSLNDMEPPVPSAFQACADADNIVNSAYGYVLFNPDAVEGELCLYHQVVQAFLAKGPATRHGVAIITDRNIHQLSSENGRKDFICTNALNFMITPEGKINLYAQMRSMDAVYGYRADYSMWDVLLDMLVRRLTAEGWDVSRGDIVFQVANLHVYPKHLELLADEAESVAEMIDRRVWRGLASTNDQH